MEPMSRLEPGSQMGSVTSPQGKWMKNGSFTLKQMNIIFD
jgi:hypothetical protein